FRGAWWSQTSSIKQGARGEHSWVLFVRPRLEHREEGLLGDLHVAHHLHTLLAFLLFLQELALARDVTAIALGGDVLAEGVDRRAGDDVAADGALDGDLEVLPRDGLGQPLAVVEGGVPGLL